MLRPETKYAQNDNGLLWGPCCGMPNLPDQVLGPSISKMLSDRSSFPSIGTVDVPMS
jgi:hypothetical protein